MCPKCYEAIIVSLQQVKSLNGLTELICWACRLVCNVSNTSQFFLGSSKGVYLLCAALTTQNTIYLYYAS